MAKEKLPADPRLVASIELETRSEGVYLPVKAQPGTTRRSGRLPKGLRDASCGKREGE